MEITANASQAVTSGNNILFTNTTIQGNCSIIHREGSGLVTLRGTPNGQYRARFRIYYSGNIKADSSETVEGVTLLSAALSLNGEPIDTTTMIVTVGDTTSIYNINTCTYVDVPTNCCATIAVRNISSITIDAINSNLIIERVA